MLETFQTLLAGIVANPNQPASSFATLTADESHQLLVEWIPALAQDTCIHLLFEAQAEISPDAIAVVLQTSN